MVYSVADIKLIKKNNSLNSYSLLSEYFKELEISRSPRESK